jgi:hypothetical protein
MRHFALAGLVLAAMACSPVRAEAEKEEIKNAPEAKPAAQKAPEALQKSIDGGIELLEKEQFEKALQLLAPPEMIAPEQADELKNIAEEFKKDGKSAMLLAALKFIKDKQPVVSDEGKKAVYSLKDAKVEGREEIEFMCENGRWFVK